MTARPKKLKFESSEATIVVKNSLGTSGEGYPTSGRHNPGKIEVVPWETHEDQRRTLLHEAMHEVWSLSGLRDRFPMKTEETIITMMEPWLFVLFRDNPDFVDWLVEETP